MWAGMYSVIYDVGAGMYCMIYSVGAEMYYMIYDMGTAGARSNRLPGTRKSETFCSGFLDHFCSTYWARFRVPKSVPVFRRAETELLDFLESGLSAFPFSGPILVPENGSNLGSKIGPK